MVLVSNAKITFNIHDVVLYCTALCYHHFLFILSTVYGGEDKITLSYVGKFKGTALKGLFDELLNIKQPNTMKNKEFQHQKLLHVDDIY